MVIILKNGRGVLFVPELKNLTDSKWLQRTMFEADKPTKDIMNANSLVEEIQQFFTTTLSIVAESIIRSYSLGTQTTTMRLLNWALAAAEYNNIDRENENKKNTKGEDEAPF